MQIEEVDIKNLIWDEENPNQMTEEQLTFLKNSIKKIRKSSTHHS